MQKLLAGLCLAVSSTTWAASSQVQVYGLLATYIDHREVQGTGVNRVSSAPSKIGFRGSEDLGNGFRAVFKIETDVPTDNFKASPRSFGDKETTVGLVHQSGSVRLGRAFHTLFKHHAFFGEPGDENMNASLGELHDMRGYRIGNAVMVTAGSKVLELELAHGFSEQVGVDDITVIAAKSQIGAITAGATWYQAGSDDRTIQLVGNLQIRQGTNVTAVWSDHEYANAPAKTAWQVGFDQSLGGPISIAANYGENDVGGEGYNVIGTYRLSKRTSILAKYRDITLAGSNEKLTALGIHHAF